MEDGVNASWYVAARPAGYWQMAEHSGRSEYGKRMTTPQIVPEKITKPIQLLAVWLAGLVVLEGMFLTAALKATTPAWLGPLLGVSAILFVPLFLALVFLMQTRFRPQLQEDPYYSKYLQLISVNPGDVDQSVAIRKGIEVSFKSIEQHIGELEAEIRCNAANKDNSAAPQEIQRLERIKEEHERLITDISHQIRAPLHSLLAAVGHLRVLMAQKQQKPDEVAAVISRIEAVVFRCRMVMETVRFQVAAGEQQPLLKEPVNVQQLVWEVVHSLKPFADARGNSIIVASNAPCGTIQGNADALKAALYNILENALNYSFSDKSVQVTVSRASNAVEIRVENEGVGITEEEIPMVFKRGYRAAARAGRYTEGSGLGLFVTAEIMRMHGGRVEIRASGPNRVVSSLILPT